MARCFGTARPARHRSTLEVRRGAAEKDSPFSCARHSPATRGKRIPINHLQPSSRSGFFGKPWSEYAADFLDEDDDWQEDGKVHHAGGHILHGKWSVDFECDEDNKDCFYQESATVLARGDYDGDGWEDKIVSTDKMSKSGSGRSYCRRLFTRRQSGRVFDTSNRLLLDRALSPAMMIEMRAQLKQGFGVPQGVLYRIPLLTQVFE